MPSVYLRHRRSISVAATTPNAVEIATSSTKSATASRWAASRRTGRSIMVWPRCRTTRANTTRKSRRRQCERIASMLSGVDRVREPGEEKREERPRRHTKGGQGEVLRGCYVAYQTLPSGLVEQRP